MDNRFYERPVLNSPYKHPARHWELDAQGQPTQKIIERRRRAEFITPIPKPRKRKGKDRQQGFVFDEGKGLSTQAQQYDPTPIINERRRITCIEIQTLMDKDMQNKNIASYPVPIQYFQNSRTDSSIWSRQQ